jgi:predicted ester cyclase
MQAMPSFDVEDFIYQTTDDIWNRRMVGRLYERAAATVAVHGPSGQELYGREDLVGDVIRWLAAFPDTDLAIQNLIWSGDDQQGYLVSVRHSRTGIHHGHSIYGPPSGQEATCHGITHYLVLDGLIREVWQEYDELGLIEQLGLDLEDGLDQLAAWRPLEVSDPFGVGEIKRNQGQMPPAVLPAGSADPFDGALLLEQSLHDIWNRRLVGHIDQVYHENLCWQQGGRQPAGRPELTAHVLSRLAAFPDLSLHIDQVFCQGSEAEGYRTAMAWTLLGTYAGPGAYGPPTARRVRLQGISQQRLEAGVIVAEWTQWGELGLRQQLKFSGRMAKAKLSFRTTHAVPQHVRAAQVCKSASGE